MSHTAEMIIDSGNETVGASMVLVGLWGVLIRVVDNQPLTTGLDWLVATTNPIEHLKIGC